MGKLESGKHTFNEFSHFQNEFPVVMFMLAGLADVVAG